MQMVGCDHLQDLHASRGMRLFNLKSLAPVVLLFYVLLFHVCVQVLEALT